MYYIYSIRISNSNKLLVFPNSWFFWSWSHHNSMKGKTWFEQLDVISNCIYWSKLKLVSYCNHNCWKDLQLCWKQKYCRIFAILFTSCLLYIWARNYLDIKVETPKPKVALLFIYFFYGYSTVITVQLVVITDFFNIWFLPHYGCDPTAQYPLKKVQFLMVGEGEGLCLDILAISCFFLTICSLLWRNREQVTSNIRLISDSIHTNSVGSYSQR